VRAEGGINRRVWRGRGARIVPNRRLLRRSRSGPSVRERERERERESVTVRERGRNGPWAAFGRGPDSVPEALLLFSYFLSLFFSVFF
jgi:hypothetical protein